MKYIFCFFIGSLTGYLFSSLINTTALPSEENVELTTTLTNAPQEVIIHSDMTAQEDEDFIGKPQYKVTEKYFRDQPRMSTEVSSQTLKSYSTEIERLKNENNQLSAQIKKTKYQLQDMTMKKESLDQSDITDLQMESLSSDEFAKMRTIYTGKQRDDIYNFHQEAEDTDWGYQMSNNISDFIQTHYNANDVILVGITCKINRCELLIIELFDGGWQKIINEMTRQQWWKFTSFHSTSQNGDEESTLSYSYLSM